MSHHKTLKQTQERTRYAREEMATKIFAWEAVAKKIGDRAMKGWDWVCIAPELPLCLKSTPAAEAIEQKLKAKGFTCQWERTTLGVDDRQNKEGEAITFEALRIQWN